MKNQLNALFIAFKFSSWADQGAEQSNFPCSSPLFCSAHDLFDTIINKFLSWAEQNKEQSLGLERTIISAPNSFLEANQFG